MPQKISEWRYILSLHKGLTGWKCYYTSVLFLFNFLLIFAYISTNIIVYKICMKVNEKLKNTKENFNLRKITILKFQKGSFFMAFGQPTNYFSNPYGGYNYMNPNYNQNYIQPTQPTIQQQQITPVQQIASPTTTPSYPMIYGKIAENYDIVKVSEIPIGGYGVFPLADSSKVYIKMYDKDGNPQTYTYELAKDKTIKQEDLYGNKLNDIYDYLEKLDRKIDDITSGSRPNNSSPIRKKKTEVSEDE